MTQDTALNKAKLATEAAANSECIARVQDYLARTGLAIPDLARRVGYGRSSISFFLAGTYHNVAGTAVHLVAKLNAFMDAHPVAPLTRVMGDLYDTANVRKIHETFQKLLPSPVAYVMYAPPGSQKSFVLEHEVARLNQAEMADSVGSRAFYVYARQGIRPRDLMRRVAIACGCRVSNDVDTMLTGIRFEFRNQRAVLAVDEAQHLSIDCFETLRELLDQPPYFSLLFAGSHDLPRKFDEFSATLEQWNSRIIDKVRLPGLEHAEAVGIIEREIGELLRARQPHKAKAMVETLIAGATSRDAFSKNESYINVRTLTNALNQIKSAQLPPAPVTPAAHQAAEKAEAIQ